MPRKRTKPTYAELRHAMGLKTAAEVARHGPTRRRKVPGGKPPRSNPTEAQILANYYRAYPKARRSRNVARHLQGLQGASGRAQKKSPFGGFGLFGKVQILQGKRKGRAPKPVRNARRRIRRKA